jgi:hypothetical protein
MRTLMLGVLAAAALAILAGPDAALARWFDHPNSGRCPSNLIRVTNLRVCARFDRNGHRISDTALVPLRQFEKYGVSRLRYE